LLSVLLVLVAFSCFYFMPPLRSQTVSYTTEDPSSGQRTETSAAERPGIAKPLEFIGIACLVLAGWLWRKELGVTQLGPLGGDPVSQQDAGSPPRTLDESGPPPALDVAAISTEMADAETRGRLQLIMQMFERVHSLNVSRVAAELGVSAHTAKTYLFFLTKTGQLRADGFPKRTIYTPVKSLENRILDAVKRRLSERYGVLSERRYVRIRRMYEADSLLESEATSFIVEAKVLRKRGDVAPRLGTWVPQLLSVAAELPTTRVACVLALACLDDADPTSVRRQVEAMTFDSGSIPVEVMVLGESDLPE
jgi:hypothetical protein